MNIVEQEVPVEAEDGQVTYRVILEPKRGVRPHHARAASVPKTMLRSMHESAYAKN